MGGRPALLLLLKLLLLLSIIVFQFVAGGAGKKKPTAVASRGFLSKAFSTSTSANGIAGYDDDQNDMSNYCIHCGRENTVGLRTGQAQALSNLDALFA